ncbi:uncharacterized protein M421DRAFT_5390 [Didymella exigua CBS 183.55]|uniref:Uncharacterized protein n=1 Tax=Didymella exigua CBS 183.55 TaxID=1150837 RepID=A0A6A5RL14_9PLEO|nr:uncharacterized protein M421DRAFT_5390 [Didymella exigua CBS 183.55]KAF1928339.1 hypothetical protein M421DRAFT_5390 [Didymella exigua CBS 183.55]
MSAFAANLAESTGTKRGLIHFEEGPKGLKELDATMQAFKSHTCDANGPKDIRTEDVQKVLVKGSWEYKLDGNDHAQQKESELLFIVGYVLMTASGSQELGELLKAKRSGVQVPSKVLEDARYVVKGLNESRAGELIVEQILPRAIDLHIDFEVEEGGDGPPDKF